MEAWSLGLNGIGVPQGTLKEVLGDWVDTVRTRDSFPPEGEVRCEVISRVGVQLLSSLTSGAAGWLPSLCGACVL